VDHEAPRAKVLMVDVNHPTARTPTIGRTAWMTVAGAPADHVTVSRNGTKWIWSPQSTTAKSGSAEAGSSEELRLGLAQ
jgi:hypothetical protein